MATSQITSLKKTAFAVGLVFDNTSNALAGWKNNQTSITGEIVLGVGIRKPILAFSRYGRGLCTPGITDKFIPIDRHPYMRSPKRPAATKYVFLVMVLAGQAYKLSGRKEEESGQ